MSGSGAALVGRRCRQTDLPNLRFSGRLSGRSRKVCRRKTKIRRNLVIPSRFGTKRQTSVRRFSRPSELLAKVCRTARLSHSYTTPQTAAPAPVRPTDAESLAEIQQPVPAHFPTSPETKTEAVLNAAVCPAYAREGVRQAGLSAAATALCPRRTKVCRKVEAARQASAITVSAGG